MSKESYFSTSYAAARNRFITAAETTGAQLSSFPIHVSGEEANKYSIDVATIGPTDSATIVLSSGVHGVEGFLGSALQLAFLDQFRELGNEGVRFVLVHAINPVGFASGRRFDQFNVDLNRNFLPDEKAYQGAPARYEQLNGFLNPKSPPNPREPFRCKALMQVLRYGIKALKQSVAGGQYKFPEGIFFGGHRPSPSAAAVMQMCSDWFREGHKTLHIDIHSGLGSFGNYKLLLAESPDSQEVEWYTNVFGAKTIEPTPDATGTAYLASGPIGIWLQQQFGHENYHFVTAEFGTYDPIRVLGALRAENRAHHYATRDSSSYQWAKGELLECFCPSSPKWKRQVITQGIKIIQQGIAGLSL